MPGHLLGVGDAPRLRAELLEGVGADGSEQALADVYSADFERLVRLAYLLTGSRATAEDLVQDSFLRLHDRWDDVRAPSAYLRTVVLNACRAHHRRARREAAAFGDLVRDGVQPETPVLLDALARLPYRQRAALVLRFYEDWPDAEIAALLRCRPATVRSLVHRGLAALRKVIT
ncbi:MAG TPA: sigma-70 family RNA polymerase sigma factor [Acidimicrobiales bacterium]|nr:sigma-70 family RNA polymerase sigma factor [Acidimicrobiales bacterium]